MRLFIKKAKNITKMMRINSKILLIL